MSGLRLDILGWLLIPVAVVAVSIVWVLWRGRTRGPVDPHDSMAELARFREAMARQLREEPIRARQPSTTPGARDLDSRGRDVS